MAARSPLVAEAGVPLQIRRPPDRIGAALQRASQRSSRLLQSRCTARVPRACGSHPERAEGWAHRRRGRRAHAGTFCGLIEADVARTWAATSAWQQSVRLDTNRHPAPGSSNDPVPGVLRVLALQLRVIPDGPAWNHAEGAGVQRPFASSTSRPAGDTTKMSASRTIATGPLRVLRALAAGGTRRRPLPIGIAAILASMLLPGAVLASQTVDLTQAASGRTISIAVGTSVTIDLESNASTGYHWVVATAPDAGVLEAEPGSGDYAAPTSDLLGAPGRQTFRYRARSHGTTELVLTYVAPGTGTVGQTFRLTVDVTPTSLPATTSGTGERGTPVPLLALLGVLALASGLGAFVARGARSRRAA